MIRIDPTMCVGCNACIRACPVNDANISQRIEGRDVIDVNEKTVSAAEPASKPVPTMQDITMMIPDGFSVISKAERRSRCLWLHLFVWLLAAAGKTSLKC